MYTVTASDPTAPRGLQPRSVPETVITDCAPLAMSAPAHDPTLLLAALEEIEARRAAIEWLRDANLLRLCLG